MTACAKECGDQAFVWQPEPGVTYSKPWVVLGTNPIIFEHADDCTCGGPCPRYVMPERVKREVERILNRIARDWLNEYFDLLERQRKGKTLTEEQGKRLEMLRSHMVGDSMVVRL